MLNDRGQHRPPPLPQGLVAPQLPAIPASHITAFTVMAAAVFGLTWQGATVIEALAIVEALVGSVALLVWRRVARP